MTELQVKQLSASYGAQRVLQDLILALNHSNCWSFWGHQAVAKPRYLICWRGLSPP